MEDAEKLALSDRLLQAVLAEAQVVCVGQPMLIAGDLIILCLAKVLLLEGMLIWPLLILWVLVSLLIFLVLLIWKMVLVFARISLLAVLMLSWCFSGVLCY